MVAEFESVGAVASDSSMSVMAIESERVVAELSSLVEVIVMEQLVAAS